MFSYTVAAFRGSAAASLVPANVLVTKKSEYGILFSCFSSNRKCLHRVYSPECVVSTPPVEAYQIIILLLSFFIFLTNLVVLVYVGW